MVVDGGERGKIVCMRKRGASKRGRTILSPTAGADADLELGQCAGNRFGEAMERAKR